jgi:hypothetical protein
MKNEITKFKKQEITVYDKKGEVITFIPNKKNKNIGLILVSILCVIFMCFSGYLLLNDSPEKPKDEQVTEELSNNQIFEEDKYRDEDKLSDVDTSYVPSKKLRTSPQICGIVLKKGFDVTSDGKNYWFEISDDKTGKVTRVDKIPNVVWKYSDEGKTEFCN